MTLGGLAASFELGATETEEPGFTGAGSAWGEW
jgi:hypothetical protein